MEDIFDGNCDIFRIKMVSKLSETIRKETVLDIRREIEPNFTPKIAFEERMGLIESWRDYAVDQIQRVLDQASSYELKQRQNTSMINKATDHISLIHKDIEDL
jgi:hypothetical protein